MKAHDAVSVTMNGSEVVSLVWIAFYILFALVAFRFADRAENQQLVERVGAVIFAMVIVATYAGAMATQYFVAAMDIPWVRDSAINTLGIVLSIILTWAIAFRAWYWLGGLLIAGIVFGLFAGLIFQI